MRTDKSIENLKHQVFNWFFKVLVIAGWGMGEDFVERFTELQVNDQSQEDRVVQRFLGFSTLLLLVMLKSSLFLSSQEGIYLS